MCKNEMSSAGIRYSQLQSQARGRKLLHVCLQVWSLTSLAHIYKLYICRRPNLNLTKRLLFITNLIAKYRHQGSLDKDQPTFKYWQRTSNTIYTKQKSLHSTVHADQQEFYIILTILLKKQNCCFRSCYLQGISEQSPERKTFQTS